MAVCPTCGAQNAPEARFCSTCGTKVGGEATAAREVRKLVTILFADVTGSTALGEQLDPETLRTLMGRYFAAMKRIIEGHGGTVEKFIGDAVMAVFGIPLVHEDDALRAVRAAAEIRTELDRLNAELTASRGLVIRFRTGVNTGEVVAGDPATGQTLVTGDTVNTAARLEQAAPPGEVLLGKLTYNLVRDAVEVEPVEPIVAKGKAEPVPAYRLVAVRGGQPGHARRLDAPLVGRERELDRLEQAFAQAIADRSCQLFTLLGTAGVGKSRLVAEFIAAEEADATVLRGRCLSYGEGITYWPIGEIVRAAAGIDEADTADAARAKIGELLEGEREADVLATRVAAAVGLSAEPAPQEELFWAIRRLLEHLARERPLVVLIEDIHWAEPTLLDLLEHIADWSRDAPLLLLCPARPELLDARPGWGGGKLNATTILLEALPAEATGRLIAALPGGMALPEPVVERIQAAAEGNPLYVEELLAMLVDDGLLRQQPDATWQASETIADVRVPPTISALLAARLERLGPAERSVAEAASVIGRVFEQAAVSELSEDALRPEVARSLLALVRKELVRPDRSEITAGDAFKFRHMLIRDAAYEALPKAERAVLHERFADWLERTAGDRLTELEEIHGYHLERAHHYRIELGETGAQVEQLGARAGERFATAGMRAYERGDTNAAAGLLGSAVDLGGPNASPGLILEFGNAAARTSTGVGAGLEALARARDLGRAQGDRRVAALAECLIAMFAIDDGAPSAALIAAATSAIGVLEELGDGRELGRVEAMLGMGYWVQGSLAEAAAHYELGVAHSLAAGDQGRAILNAAVALGVLMEGPAHGAAVRSKAESLLEESPGRGDVRQFALSVLAEISAAEGDASGARNAMAEAIGIAIERGDLQSLGSHHAIASGIERMFSEPAAAVAHDRAALEVVRGGAAFWARASLARSLVDLGSNEEALQVTSQDTDRVDVMDPQVGSLHLRARALALGSLGQRDEAQQLARASIALVGATDAYPATGAALVDAGTVLARGGEAREAQEYAKRAIAIYQTKGNVVMERKARELLEHPSR